MAVSIDILPGVGAFAHNIQITPVMPETEFAVLRQAYGDHGVLFWRTRD